MTICTDCCESKAVILVHEAGIQLCEACWDARLALWAKTADEMQEAIKDW